MDSRLACPAPGGLSGQLVCLCGKEDPVLHCTPSLGLTQPAEPLPGFHSSKRVDMLPLNHKKLPNWCIEERNEKMPVTEGSNATELHRTLCPGQWAQAGAAASSRGQQLHQNPGACPTLIQPPFTYSVPIQLPRAASGVLPQLLRRQRGPFLKWCY